MTNIATIRAHLDSPIYDEIKLANRKSFVDYVGRCLARWSAEVVAYVPEPNDRWQRKFPDAGYNSRFFTKPQSVAAIKDLYTAADVCRLHDAEIAAVKAGEYAVDVAKAEQEADRRWQADKDFYAHRVGLKLDEMLQADAQIDCNLERSVYLIGTVTATVDGKTLVLRTSLKTNYRYGENAANGDITIYRQVPTVIQSASGFDPAARERQIRYEASAAKSARAARLAELGKELRLLERRKRRWDDLYSTLRYSANHGTGLPINGNLQAVRETMAELGIAGETLPTLNEAKLQYLDLRAQVKAAKLALKVAKAAKA